MRLRLEVVMMTAALVVAGGSPPDAFAQSVVPSPARWNSHGFIRVFEENGSRLLSGIYRTGGSDNGASTFTANSDLRLTSATTVTSMEATVTLLDGSLVGTGFTTSPRAGLEGFFYWNGTGTGSATDDTGHVTAGVSLALNSTTGLSEARYFVTRCLDADCDSSTTLTSGALGSVKFFEPHRLRVSYDGTRFSFQLDSGTATTFTAPDATRNTPTVAFKALRTRAVLPASPTASVTLVALFDDLLVNGASYESFDARTLPRVTVMPGSGTFTSTQLSDVVIAVETGGLSVATIKVFLDGADVSPLLAALTPGTLITGGITRRLKNFPVSALPPGPHLVGVEVTLAGGRMARGFALWNVLPASGP
jgi:hypothetical protein